MPAYGTGPYGMGLYGGGVTGAPTFAIAAAFGSTLLSGLVVGAGLVGAASSTVVGSFANYTYTDLSDRFQGFEIKRGRADEWSGMTAGDCTATLDDNDGALDPRNTGSPYSPNVKAMRPVQVTATYAGVTYTLFQGFIDDLLATPTPVGADVALHATDLYARLNNRRLSVTLPAATVGARIGALLDYLQWPTTLRALDTGRFQVPATTLVSVPFLQHISDLLTAEQGQFWIDGGGVARYWDRYHRLTETSIGIIGAGGLAVTSVAPDYNVASVYNEIVGTTTDGRSVAVSDAQSQYDYDIRNYTIPTASVDLLPNIQEVTNTANWILSQRKDPRAVVQSVTLDPDADPTLWPLVLGAEVGQRVTLTHNVPGTKGIIAQDYFIENVAWKWDAANLEMTATWGLSQADTTAWLIVGDATKGLVGTGILAA